MEIRRLDQRDAEGYAAIRLTALQQHPEAFATSYEEEKIRVIEKYRQRFRSTDSFTFGAFKLDKLVGVVTLIREKHLKLRHRANIVAMYVASEQRGLGIGWKLLDKAIKQATKLDGVEQVYVSVVKTNETARGLYLSRGFETFGTEKNALKIGSTYFDEDHMVLFLNTDQ